MIKVFVGTPTLDQKVTTGYLNTIIMVNSLAPDIMFSVFTLGGNSMITDCRNQIASIFLTTDFDYLLFLDSDVELQPLDIKRLIVEEKDVIAIPILRKNPVQPTVNMGNVIGHISPDGIAEVDGIATAAMLISRKVLEKIIENRATYNSGDANLVNNSKLSVPTFYDIFRAGVIDNKYVCEDYQFCHDVIKLGFKVHAYMGAKSSHYGTVPFRYNGL